MKVFRVGIAVFFSILFVVLMPVVVLLYRADTYVLQPEPLIQALHRVDLYNRIVPALTEAVVTDALIQQMSLPISGVDARQAIQVVCSASWLRGSVEHLLSEVFALRSPGALLADREAVIVLEAPKQALREQVSILLTRVQEEFAFYPQCSSAQLVRLESQFQEADELKAGDEEGATGVFEAIRAEHCWPVQLFGSVDRLDSSLLPVDPATIIDLIPDRVFVLRFFLPKQLTVQADDPLGLKVYGEPLTPLERTQFTQAQETIDAVQKAVQGLHLGARILFVLLSLLLLAILLLTRFEKRISWMWIGVVLLIPNMLLSSVGFVGTQTAQLLRFIPDSALEQLPAAFQTIILDIVQVYTQGFFALPLWFGVIGVMLSIAAFGYHFSRPALTRK